MSFIFIFSYASGYEPKSYKAWASLHNSSSENTILIITKNNNFILKISF